jgi:hypothetical protein
MRVVLLIGMVIFVGVIYLATLDLADMIPSKQNYTDSLKSIIKANERTIWLLRNDSMTHQRCFRIND